VLGVQRVHRDDRVLQVGERLEQLADRGDLVALRVDGDLAEDRADAVGQGRDQVRGLTALLLRAADGLAVDRDHRAAVGPGGPGPQPRPEDRVEGIGADLGERPPVGGLVGRSPGRAQRGEHVGAGVGGPLPDCRERPRPGGHGRDPHGERPGQRVPPPALLALVRNLGQQIEE